MKGLSVSLKAKKVAKEMEERHKKNVEYIAKTVPNFYQAVLSKKGKFDVTIDIANDGNVNLLINGNKVFPTDKPFKMYQQQFKEFQKNPGLIMTNITKVKSDFDTLNHRMLNRINDHKALENIDESSVNWDKKTIPLIVVFGVGLGYHLQWLVENYDIYNMILVDIDYELIKPSLYTINWKKVIESIYKKGGEITFIIETEDPFVGIDVLINKIKAIHPALGTFLFVYEHYENDFINQAKEFLKDKYIEVIRGFGFFDDEIWAIEHTYKNIKNQVKVYYGDVETDNSVPAFIVGAGPSLDQTIEIVKKYKDNAVIFSCGTVLKRFMAEGLYPDFHIEIERTKDTFDKLEFIYDEEYFKNLFIAMASNVYPDVLKLSGDGGIFLKGGDSGMLFFINLPEAQRLEPVNPTVANGAMALALSMGFKNIYLFGIDLGFKDPRKHHTSKTVYDDENFFAYLEEFKNVFTVKGNFTEEVFTEDIYNFSRLILQNQIKAYKSIYPDLKVYNASDGAYIEETIPLKPEDIKIETAVLKHKEVERLKSNFKRDYITKLNPDQDLETYCDNAITVADQLYQLHDKPVNNLIDYIKQILEVNKYLNSINFLYYLLYRGSMWQFHTQAYFLSLKIHHDKERTDYLNYSNQVVKEFLQESKKVLTKLKSYSKIIT